MQTIKHKIGMTFSCSGQLTLPSGTWSADCEARDPDTNALVQTFDVTLTPPVSPATDHTITIRAESDETALWTANKRLRCDIVFSDTSSPPVKVPTSTFYIETQAKVTDV